MVLKRPRIKALSYLNYEEVLARIMTNSFKVVHNPMDIREMNEFNEKCEYTAEAQCQGIITDVFALEAYVEAAYQEDRYGRERFLALGDKI